jgi:hypothetical protein
MITSGQLAALVGRRLRAKRAGPPTPDIPAALSRRRARTTVALSTLPVAAAAIAAAAFLLPGPRTPATQDTAYVASLATRALTTVPPGTIFFVQSTITRPGSDVTDTWASYGRLRIEVFKSGQPVSDMGHVRTSTTETAVVINYRERTWTRATSHFGKLSAPPAGTQGSFACDSANKIFGIPTDASDLAASLRDWESCGWLKSDGTATLGGVTDIRLTMPEGGGYATTWYVNPATYLPTRQTVTRRGTLLSAQDFQWLPPTAANLAKLDLPVPPSGFTRESWAACQRSPGGC